ncbi:MAG: transcription elongation factor GreA [Microthrixaceae bacterium]|jgi:transcription elongation factor GreA|nr:transcription elongation factor GreA [Actinomycetota bacterium]HMS14203.1 transcription elongation factor GreA [Microthrixaceae bacterium]HMT25779.1 transcription elongation factor GreA [Microthrixaceae bacterium]HMT61975.1 transcription elongation factor GreA [Microthrixaceae bacterium]
MSVHEHQLSQAAYDRLKSELVYLTTEWRIDIARKIEAAREMGDLSENGDYHAAKEEQGKTEARIGHLSALIERAVIIDHEGDIDSVVQGTVVTILYEDDDDEEQYLIGSIEERRDGIEVISPTSPLGEALLGAKAGDEVTFEAPSGPLKVEVIRIER